MKGSATLEKLVLPEEVKEGTVPSWSELVSVAQRQGVVVEYEECDAEDDVAIFEALRREMKFVEVVGWPAVRS